MGIVRLGMLLVKFIVALNIQDITPQKVIAVLIALPILGIHKRNYVKVRTFGASVKSPKKRCEAYKPRIGCGKLINKAL